MAVRAESTEVGIVGSNSIDNPVETRTGRG